MYLYRAVDKAGKTVDFYLSRRRDGNAAKAFLPKAMKGQRVPVKVTLDAYAASHRAVAGLKEDGELPKRVRVRSSKYGEAVIGGIDYSRSRRANHSRPQYLPICTRTGITSATIDRDAAIRCRGRRTQRHRHLDPGPPIPRLRRQRALR
ncbi:MAG: DDE-type integrase/transposase/recombinase [Acidobacteria bacterium]|nr:DDE-type integrase/transposase/recombinase [Acidobacteriota bacterium]